MKKSNFIASIVFAFLMLVSFNVNAQEFKGLDASPMDAASFPSSYKESDKLVKITYSRPQLKGRSIGKLAPSEQIKMMKQQMKKGGVPNQHFGGQQRRR